MGYTFTFKQGSPRGKAKIKKFTRRHLLSMPAHKRKDREETSER